MLVGGNSNMTALVYKNTHRSNRLNQSLHVISQHFSFLMSDKFSMKKANRLYKVRRSLSEAFMDYLEGYMDAFNYYPICKSQSLQSRDIHAVVEDFMRTHQKLARTQKDIMLNTDELLRNLVDDKDEREKYKGKLAKTDHK